MKNNPNNRCRDPKCKECLKAPLSNNLSNWSERFDETFYEGRENSVFCKKHKIYATPFEIKQFISKTLSQAITEEREALRKKIEERFSKSCMSICSRHREFNGECEICFSGMIHMRDILNLLQE